MSILSNTPHSITKWGSISLPHRPTSAQERLTSFEERRGAVHKQFRRWGNILTSPPRGKAPPSDSQIREALADQKIQGKVYTPFVRDLCNLAAGGTLNPMATWDALIKPSLKRYAREMLSRRISEPEQAKTVTNHVKLLSKTADFYRGIDFSKVPGRTALEKAISVVLAMQSKNTKEMWGYQRNQSQAESEDIVANPGSGKEAAAQVMAVFSDLSDLSPEEMELLLADKTPGNGASKGTHFNDVELQRQAAEELLSNPVKQQMYRIARTLEHYSEMDSHIPLEVTRDPNGEDVQRRQMESFNEVSKVDKSNWALYQEAPILFWQKILSREMMVRERIVRSRKKQLLYMLIDVSGSMDSAERIGTACGILMNRLKAVIAGDAELYYRFFDGDVYQEYEARTKDQAREAMKRVLTKNFSGGSTSIDKALKAGIQAVNRRTKDGSLVKPHIVVVSDGCDEISVGKEDLGNTVLHAFLCGGSNEALTSLAKRSAGVGVVITR
jgi:uncharacterized protein with von Willebrand factor type A (vWA) domain